MTIQIENTLPSGWCSATLDQLVPFDGLFKDGDWVESKDQDPNGEVRLIQLADVGDNFFVDKSARYLTTKKSIELNCSYLKQGDILIARMPDPLGRSCIFPLQGESKFVTVVDVCIIRLNAEQISNKFLSYWINSPLVRHKIDTLKSGSTRKRISRKNLATVEFPIPPYAEQHRIVAKIEELFSELDKGIESLKRAREQLKVYRQALLKHAFEGKLTEQWRKDNADKLETAAQLLERIKQEREARYQQQLEEWKAAVKQWEAGGKEGRKLAKPKMQKEKDELTDEQLAILPELPDSFVYTYLDYLGDLGRGKSKHRPRNDPQLFGGKYPFIQTGEVKAANRVVTNHEQMLSEFGLAQSKLWPKGTLCITIAANIAETAFLGFDGCFPDSVVGFTAYKGLMNPKYVELFIMSARARIEAYAPATAQKNINLTTLENLVVPLTSLEEQAQVVEYLDEQFSIIDRNITDIEINLLKSDALRQSILKKAFSGQLVPQDPDDEPASVLLDRIAKEKEEAAAKAKKAKAAKRKTKKGGSA